ncbi:MAG TPA: HisA/HisF-related TIM barrel protein [Methylocella sp.]|nr:HisA/HisF-related TIM barrel protein [Methylocella sp.]
MAEHKIEVIPVLDLKSGAVVHARGGERQSYSPIVTPLAASSDPLDVARGLLAVHPFQTLYLADLDRIQLFGDQGTVIEALGDAFPEVTLWADVGVRDADEARVWLAHHKKAHLVLGSESVRNFSSLEQLESLDRTILSLDYRVGRFLGPQEVLSFPHAWPSRVIVMSLSRVGSNAGPDMARLLEIKSRSPHSKLYAAGGVRGRDDLAELERAGIFGVLVATALHDGRLSSEDLRR